MFSFCQVYGSRIAAVPTNSDVQRFKYMNATKQTRPQNWGDFNDFVADAGAGKLPRFSYLQPVGETDMREEARPPLSHLDQPFDGRQWKSAYQGVLCYCEKASGSLGQFIAEPSKRHSIASLSEQFSWKLSSPTSCSKRSETSCGAVCSRFKQSSRTCASSRGDFLHHYNALRRTSTPPNS